MAFTTDQPMGGLSHEAWKDTALAVKTWPRKRNNFSA
jgi:hypothetical protein